MARPRRTSFVAEWEDEWYYLYARISSDQKKRKKRNGKTRERENINSQFSRLHAECDRRGVPKNRRVEIFDNDISASRFSTKEREGYDKLIKRIKVSRNCTVMAVEQSRLVRRDDEAYTLKDLLLGHDMRLALLTGDVDLTTDSGDLQWTFALFKDRSESNTISRRAKGERKTDREDLGIHYSAGAAFGYADREFTTIVPAEAVMLDNLRQHITVRDGERTGTIGECTRMMADAGFVSPRTGKPYTRNAVAGMLRNPMYAGWVVHEGVKIRKSTHIEPIFTDREFDELQERMTAISGAAVAARGGRIQTGRKHVLSGFLRCGHPGCGARMEIATRKGVRRWQCTNGAHTSRNYATVAEAVDLWVAGWFARARVAAVQDVEVDPRAAELDGKIATLEGRLAALVERYADPASPITDDQYFTLSARLRDSVTVLQSERASMERKAVATVPVDGLDIWMDDRPECLPARRALLDDLVAYVVIKPVGNTCGPKPAPLESVQVYPRRVAAAAEVVATAERLAS